MKQRASLLADGLSFWFDSRDERTIASRPFDGMTVAELVRGTEYLHAFYDDGAWWFDDGERVCRCRSYRRAMRLFGRRAWGRAR